jgi:putative ABC transport system permease protein
VGWGRFFRRRHWDEERARELESYLDLETDENLARGMAPDEARAAARRKLGNPTLVREEIYRMNTIGWLETVGQDLRHGGRLLRSNPAFATVAVLSLALGIGANTAIFQIFDAVRLRALPVAEPDRLVEIRIGERRAATGSFTGRRSQLTNPLWERIRAEPRGFDGLFAWGTSRFDLAAGGPARTAQGLWVSGGFFDVLGVRPVLGRLFTPADDQRGCAAPGAVISHAFWQRELGGDPSVVGRMLRLDGHLFEIVGVTPPGFFGVEVGWGYDVALPICAEPILSGEQTALDKQNAWWLAVMGRLESGWSPARMSSELAARSPGIFQQTVSPAYNVEDTRTYLAFRLGAFPAATGVSQLRGRYESPLLLLLAIAGLVLVIACANLANLMLARATAREREIAVRLAIGASRGRIIRQLLAESLLLAGIGAAIGALLAQVLSQALVSFLTTKASGVFVDLQPGGRVLAFTAGLAAFTCLLFGLAPALRATSTTPGAAMQAGGRLTDRRERFGLRRGLVVGQVALSLVLVVGALLFVRSLRNLMTAEAGFRRDGILVVTLTLPSLDAAAERRLARERGLLERLQAVPGVESAAEAEIVPVSGSGWNDRIKVGGVVQATISNVNAVSPGFFQTMGTPLLGGRDFDARDTASSPRVAIVNEAFARQLLGPANPIGRTFQIQQRPGSPEPTYEVVGLVRNSKYRDLRESFTPIAFLALAQDPAALDQYMQVMVRARGPIVGLASAIERAMAEADPGISITLQPFAEQIRQSLLRERLMATLSGFFGLLAGLLATIGLYGVMSYMVARRRREIGIRMALGADRPAVVAMVMREAALLLGVGLALGTVLASMAARAARALLFGLGPGDPNTLVMAVLALAGVAALASYLPAKRAAGVEPTLALREQ